MSLNLQGRMPNLVQQWYEVSEKDIVSTTERMELYSNTKEAIDFLNISCIEQNIETKITISNLCKIYFKEFFKPESQEKLINFISKHTSYAIDPSIKFNGAHEIFQELMGSILKVIKNPSYIILFPLYPNEYQKLLKTIDKAIIKNIENKRQDLTLLNDCQPLVYSKLSSKDLVALKEATNNVEIIDWIDNELVHRFNENLLFKELEIGMTLENVVVFFGKNCSKICNLTLGNLSQKTGNFSQKFLCHFDQNYSFLEHFPNLQRLEISHYLKECIPPDLSFLTHCPNLTNLNLINLNGVTDSTFLQYCPNLETLIVLDCPISDFRYVNHCPNLKSLNIKCPVSDFSFLKFLSKLESLQVSEFSDQGFKFLPLCNIKRFVIKNCGELTEFSPLSQIASLEELVLQKCIAQDFSFLEDCNKIKKVWLDCNYCNLNFVNFLVDRGTLVLVTNGGKIFFNNFDSMTLSNFFSLVKITR